MTPIESMFEIATELRDSGQLQDSIGVLSKILYNYPTYERIDIVYLTLGGIYSDLKELKNALDNFAKATELNPKSELASLGLYVTYAKFNRDKEAILELFRYLRKFPAQHYMDTLKELIEGLEKGYMTKYKVEIIELAKLNGITIPDK